MKSLQKLRSTIDWQPLFILGAFGLIYAATSLVNHYLFRNYLDLGMINHALYDFRHLRMNYFTLDISGAAINYFGDHFSPITILYSPFQLLFGSWTVLVFQVLSVLYGGWTIYRFAEYRLQRKSASLLALAFFLSIWGIYNALGSEFHNNVVGAMLVPGLILAYNTDRWKSFAIHFFFILIAKENMSLWLVFILAGLSLSSSKRSFSQKLRLELPLALFSGIYFIVIVGVVMPYLRAGQGMDQMIRYAHLGSSTSEILVNLLSNPLDTIKLFFTNTLQDPLYDGIKAETHYLVLGSGGIALLFRPRYLLMLIPIYAQKMFSDDYILWGINAQYSIEFAPILAIAAIDLVADKSLRIKHSWMIFLTISAMLATLITMNGRKSKWYMKDRTAVFTAKHYEADIQIKEVHEALNLIPADVTVSCSGRLSPFLYDRAKLYHYPVMKDAQYILIVPHDSEAWPLSKEEYAEKVTTLSEDTSFKLLFEKEDILVYKRLDIL